MPDFTLVNLREVEDQAPKFGLAPDVEARFARGALGLTRSGMSYQRLAPGVRHPFGHRHKEQEEVYVVLGGSATARLGDEEVDLRPFDALRVPPETARGFHAGPGGVELLVFGAPNTNPPGAPSAGDVEPVPDVWE
jgi:mannose-6-phosphate isomerase-like protein (cupin superfamily)